MPRLQGAQVKIYLAFTAVLLSASALIADAADDAAAEALAKKSGCLTCHSVDKQKDAPSFKGVAAKYKGKADAEQKIVAHITTQPKIKVDGKEETHDAVKSKNPADAKNVAQWILSR
jgi:cytochrome c